MLRCEAADCEGWALDPEDRYCPNCGNWLRPIHLLTEILLGHQWLPSTVLGSQPCRLRISYQGRTGHLDLSELRLPDWLQADNPGGVLRPGESVCLDLRVEPLSREGLPGLISCAPAQLEVWCSQPAQLEMHWSQRPLNPECSEIEGELCLLQGALYVDALPAGWHTSLELPAVLSVRARPRLRLRAAAVAGPVRWDLGVTVLEGELKCLWAGQLETPLRWPWCLTRSVRIEIPLQASQGPVEIERVECGWAELQADFPARLEGAGCLSLRLTGPAPEGSEAELRLVLRDGRVKVIHLDLSRPQRTPFPGWLLIDFGSSASGAVLVEDDGRLTQLPLGADSCYFPSGIAYLPGGLRLASDQPAANVILEAKRNLGRTSFSFRLTLPETGEVLERTPWQAVQDYFALLLERVLQAPELGLHRLERCCLAHPAAFSPRQVAELRQAFLANLDCQLEMISEPLAAAYYYLSHSRNLPPREWRLLLYDFGGTTSDVALLKVDSRARTMVSVEIEHVGGDRWFGGSDITRQVAELLSPQWRSWAETVKRNYSQPQTLPPELLPPDRTGLDAVLEPRLRLSLPSPPVNPDLIVISGRGAHYPLIGEWLQKQFPGVPLERCSQPKDCVVLGARLQPEVVRSAGPRCLGPESTWLHFPAQSGQALCTTRLGIKIMGDQGARFHPMVPLGHPLPCQVELTPLSLLPGLNRLEVVENLGWDEAYLLPDGSSNTQLVLLDTLTLRLEQVLDPATTRLRWELSAEYHLRMTVLSADQTITQVGPFSLWPNP